MTLITYAEICGSMFSRSKSETLHTGGFPIFRTHCQRDIVVVDSINVLPKQEQVKKQIDMSLKGEYKGKGCKQ